MRKLLIYSFHYFSNYKEEDKKAYCHAGTWWSGNYVKLLYPDAKLQSRRISEFLTALGDEAVQRLFFNSYLSALYGEGGNIVDVSTLCTTMAELSLYGVSIDYAIVDAGYAYIGVDMDRLCSS